MVNDLYNLYKYVTGKKSRKRKTKRRRSIPTQKIIVIHRTGEIKSRKLDYARKAKRPGWRVSSSGKRYYEARRNRSDLRGSRL